MNTVDIRDIGANQSLFWAAALPLTVIVVVVALLAGYYERLSLRLSRLVQARDHAKIE